MSKNSEEKEKSKSTKSEILKTSIYLLIVLALTFLFIQFVAQKTSVSGTSMYPTLEDGDQLIVDKISYRFGDPSRYDIIVFPYKYEEGTYYIKRIIGLPGETVGIHSEWNDKDNYYELVITIDGEVLDESYGVYDIERRRYSMDEDMDVTLGENEYFVMGDNRDYSKDSRDEWVGKIKRKDMIGKAFLRIWPFDHFGVVTHQ